MTEAYAGVLRGFPLWAIDRACQKIIAMNLGSLRLAMLLIALPRTVSEPGERGDFGQGHVLVSLLFKAAAYRRLKHASGR